MIPATRYTSMKNIILLLVLGIMLSGCMRPEPEELGLTEDIAEDASPVAGEEPAEHTVIIRGFAFHPAEMTVKQGETITWVNEDSAPHTIKFGEGFESQALMKGDTFQYTLTEPGEYPYICGIHPSMHGKVVVE